MKLSKLFTVLAIVALAIATIGLLAQGGFEVVKATNDVLEQQIRDTGVFTNSQSKRLKQPA